MAIWFYRLAEPVLILLTAGCVVEFVLIAMKKRPGCPSRRWAIMASFLYMWLLLGDLAFYLGFPYFSFWPLRPGVFRGGSFVAAGLWLWHLSLKEKNGKRNGE